MEAPTLIIRYIKKKILASYDSFISIKGSPRKIAFGFSLGIFIGMTPFLGFHIILCVALASLFGWNKLSAVIGVNITNLGTAPLIYALNYWVGLKTTGFSSAVKLSLPLDYLQMVKTIKESPLILADLSVGGIIVGAPLAFLGYFLALWAIGRLRKSPSKNGRFWFSSRT